MRLPQPYSIFGRNERSRNFLCVLRWYYIKSAFFATDLFANITFKHNDKAHRWMEAEFFARPILNSPHEVSTRHWALDGEGRPTSVVLEARRRSDLIAQAPKVKRQKAPKGKVEVTSKATRAIAT